MRVSRRVFAAQLLAAAALGRSAVAAPQVDQEWLRSWKATQAKRPAALGPAARIAPAGEPGSPLVIHGRVVAADGRTAVADAVVFAYHTDATGVYAPRGTTAHTWRLHGWSRTGAEGRFEFTTIRPAPYPGRHVPAHVHFTVESAAGGRQWADDLEFHQAPESRTGAEHVRFTIRLKPRADF